MFWEIMNRIIGRKNRIIGTGLQPSVSLTRVALLRMGTEFYAGDFWQRHNNNDNMREAVRKTSYVRRRSFTTSQDDVILPHHKL